MRARAIGLSVAVAAAAGGAWVAWSRVSAATVVVEEGLVGARMVARALVVPRGGVAEVRARIDGRVLRVHVDEGDSVRAGQLLAEIEPDLIEAEVARRAAERRAADASARALAAGSRPDEIALARAEAEAARQQWLSAEANATRAGLLSERGTISVQEREDAARTAAVARARQEEAEARLRLVRSGSRRDDVRAARERSLAAEAARVGAEEQLEWTRVVAPVDGVVLARRVDTGDTVVSTALGSVLFDVGSSTVTEVRVEVEELDGDRVAQGQPVALRTTDGRLVGSGRVARLGARFERRTIGGDSAAVRTDAQVRAVWVSWEAPPSAIIGQRLEATITLPDRRVAARVPRSALRVANGEVLVQVRSGWRVHDRPVTVGALDAEWVEVGGVAAGERVVVP